MRTRLATLSLFVLVGCGGGTQARRTLPEAESTALALLPSDAFAVARYDGVAMRASPAWPDVEALLEHTGDSEVRMLATSVDRAYVAVGGLIDVPPVPEPAGGEDGLRVPEWIGIARAFGGRLPKVIGVMEGDAASLCAVLLDRDGAREERGIRYATKDGLALLMQGPRICALTFEPVLRHILDDRGGDAPVLSRLPAMNETGDLGILAAAFELDAPSFRALLEGTQTTSSSEQDRAQVNRMKSLFEILTGGVAAIEWQVTRGDTGYVLRSRLQASDLDRGVMWREIIEIYIEVMRLFFTPHVIGEEAHAYVDRILTETRLEPRPDGFVLVNPVRDEVVHRLLEDMRPRSYGVAATEEVTVQVEATRRGTAEEIIAELEPRASGAALLSEDASALARAYASRGRYGDAKRTLRASLERASTPYDRQAVAGLLCSLEIETGHGAEALSVANQALDQCRESYCGDPSELLDCRFVARAMSGDANVLEDLDANATLFTGSGQDYAYGGTRGHVLLSQGRASEAVASLRVACRERYQNDTCGPYTVLLAEALARSGADAAATEHAFERVAALHAQSDASAAEDADESARLATLRCVALATRAPTTPEARATCELAVSRNTETHGELHPETGTAHLFLARVRRASRDEASARASLTVVDRVIATLGPSHPLRRDRDALGTQARRR